MGEMADFELEMVEDAEALWLDYIYKPMNHQEAYDAGIIDEQGNELREAWEEDR